MGTLMSMPSLSSSAEYQPAATLLADATAERWSRRVAIDVVGLIDTAVIVASVAVAGSLQSVLGGTRLEAIWLLQSGLATALVANIALRGAGYYSNLRPHALAIRPATLLAGLAIALLATLGLAMPMSVTSPHVVTWCISWLPIALFLLVISRTATRVVLARLTAAGRFDTRVAVFGSGMVARRVQDYLAGGITGIHFVGVYDDRTDESRVTADAPALSGRLEDLVCAARDDVIDQIIIALPAQAEARIQTVARKLEHLPVSLHVVTHIASDMLAEGPAHRVSNLGAVGLMDLKSRPLADWAPIVKRAEDLLIASLLLLPALPVMALIAIAIRLDSRGPVLFRQRRRGLNQRAFHVLKFRTMHVMEDGTSASQARQNDPRVTRIGWFLRRSSLDELPQLLNVLKGDMSLVGPRPHALVHDDQWGAMLERYANRHQVKPGITGLAQVRGWRGEAQSIDKIRNRVDGDLEYIANWSLWLDLTILVRTVWIVLTARNAH